MTQDAEVNDMKFPGFKMPAEKIIVSKGMLSGLGLIGFGVYLIIDGSQDFGLGMMMAGFGFMGVRDSNV